MLHTYFRTNFTTLYSVYQTESEYAYVYLSSSSSIELHIMFIFSSKCPSGILRNFGKSWQKLDTLEFFLYDEMVTVLKCLKSYSMESHLLIILPLLYSHSSR